MTGSNACTVIALLTGRHFLEGALAIPKELKDHGQTIFFYCKMIFKVITFSIYSLSDLGVSSNLIGLLSLSN